MKKTIKNNILKKIQSGDLKMRSRLEILTEKLGIGSGILLLFAVLIIISGLVSYWLKLNSDLIFGGYARFGLRIFTQTFPYTFVFIFICLFLLLSLMLRKFDVSYKKPFITILSVIIGLVVVLGWFSLNNPIGRGFYQNEGRFLGMGRMMNNANSINGQVLQVNESEIVLSIYNGEKVKIKTSNDTHYPFGTPKISDNIRCIGTWNGVYFNAMGVRVFDENDVRGMMGGYGMGGMHNGKGPMWLKQ
jgi:hypothetical protein